MVILSNKKELAEEFYPHLFSKFTLAGKILKNRIVHSAMSTRYARNGEVTDQLINYHMNRARGGASMTIAEPLAMKDGQASDKRVRVFDQNNLDKLKLWAESVRRFDCHLLTQIQEPGRGHHRLGRKAYSQGPSALPDDWSWTVPREMTKSEIKKMIEEFVFSSSKLKLAGFSGVEISAGHGHIFHQFLSPWSNQREDDYGGNIENRTRILTELIHCLRVECGNEFIIGLRLPGNDFIQGSIDFNESAKITKYFALKGNLDFFCWVQGGHHRSLEMHLPDMHMDRGTFLPEIKKLRDSSMNIPVAAVGRILEPVQGEKIIEDGTAELVMLGRSFVTDAAWGLKASQNRDNDIRKCVSCNNCWGVINLDQPLQCDNNPRVGFSEEVDWWPKQSKSKYRVVVVGGGIAGLEAAWVSAARGHDVTLFSASSFLGGKARLNAMLPGCETLSSTYDYQQVMAKKAGVNIKLNWFVNEDDILSIEPDVVILATGSTMAWPWSLPKNLENQGIILDLRTTIELLLSHSSKQKGTAVIFDADGYDGTYSSAEFMSDIYSKVVLVTEREGIARDEPVVRAQSIYRRMYEKNIEIVPLSIPSKNSDFENGNFIYTNVFTGNEDFISDVVLFTYSTQRKPNDMLYFKLKKILGDKVFLVGDCYAPRSAMIATQEGHRVGELI